MFIRINGFVGLVESKYLQLAIRQGWPKIQDFSAWIVLQYTGPGIVYSGKSARTRLNRLAWLLLQSPDELEARAVRWLENRLWVTGARLNDGFLVHPRAFALAVENMLQDCERKACRKAKRKQANG